MSSSSPSRAIAPARILMIDDNNLGLLARKAVLEELGYRVQTASTPQEALEMLAENRYELLITDYKLPSMTGAELIKRVRKQHADLPVILLSGFVDALGLEQRNTGADVVLQKSAHEVPHMVRSVKSLLKRAALLKKPPSSSRGATSSSKRKKA